MNGYVLVTVEDTKQYVMHIYRDGRFQLTSDLVEARTWSAIASIIRELHQTESVQTERSYTIGKISEIQEPKYKVTRLD